MVSPYRQSRGDFCYDIEIVRQWFYCVVKVREKHIMYRTISTIDGMTSQVRNDCEDAPVWQRTAPSQVLAGAD